MKPSIALLLHNELLKEGYYIPPTEVSVIYRKLFRSLRKQLDNNLVSEYPQLVHIDSVTLKLDEVKLHRWTSEKVLISKKEAAKLKKELSLYRFERVSADTVTYVDRLLIEKIINICPILTDTGALMSIDLLEQTKLKLKYHDTLSRNLTMRSTYVVVNRYTLFTKGEITGQAFMDKNALDESKLINFLRKCSRLFYSAIKSETAVQQFPFFMSVYLIPKILDDSDLIKQYIHAGISAALPYETEYGTFRNRQEYISWTRLKSLIPLQEDSR